MGWLRFKTWLRLTPKFLAANTSREQDAVRHELNAIVAGVPVRDGVHHEYFVDDAPVNGLLAWHCRVYAKDGAPHEMSGSAPSREAAATEAQAWAADKKRELRGIA